MATFMVHTARVPNFSNLKATYGYHTVEPPPPAPVTCGKKKHPDGDTECRGPEDPARMNITNLRPRVPPAAPAAGT